MEFAHVLHGPFQKLGRTDFYFISVRRELGLCRRSKIKLEKLTNEFQAGKKTKTQSHTITITHTISHTYRETHEILARADRTRVPKSQVS